MHTTKYITPGEFFFSEELGSQMQVMASLLSISKITGHKVVVFKEHCSKKMGYLIPRYFPNLPVEILSILDLSIESRKFLVFKPNSSKLFDDTVLKLSPDSNYIIDGNTSYYKYWWANRYEIFSYYEFQNVSKLAARSIVFEIKKDYETVVALHVRRSGHALRGIHSELKLDYYKECIKNIEIENFAILIFSDDLEHCRNVYTKTSLGREVFYSNSSSDIVDMAAMTLCDHNIIANSTFSFWGAALSKFDKMIFCPSRFVRTIKSQSEFVNVDIFNFNWHPDSWIPITNVEQFFPDDSPLDDDFSHRVILEKSRLETKHSLRPIY